jgi:hypothetical protein
LRVRSPIRCHRLSIESFQTAFHARWSGLRDPHVRALAWLIFAPDLLDPIAVQWAGKIATLPPDSDAERWLHALDMQPKELHAFLHIGPFERLGRYAEKLLAFYFQHQDKLVAHGVQVHDTHHQTIGEFDFLLRSGANLVHWEFATKLYLMEGNRDGDCFVGPNLADTLQAKMRKILDRQLALSLHPAAQALLPATVFSAQALIKGWLFYRQGEAGTLHAGVTPNHCRGFWCTHAEVDMLDAKSFTVLPRLSWLAPVQIEAQQTLDRSALLHQLAMHFANDAMPVLLAQCRIEGEIAQEISRGFIVPDDWRARAGQRAQRSCIAAA